jgi:ribosomal-protein-alanine N-acetyltransferase
MALSVNPCQVVSEKANAKLSTKSTADSQLRHAIGYNPRHPPRVACCQHFEFAMSMISISPPDETDRDRFISAVERSRDLHAQWVAPPATDAAFDAYLSRTARDDFAAYLVRLAESGELVGVYNISNIVGEPLCSAYLGFYAFEPHAKRGYMKQALRLVLARAFGEHGLHRIEANIQPGNAASIALVRSWGFQREGFSPKYLRVAGEWRDHERWALLADEFRQD